MATISHIFHVDASEEKVFNAVSTIEGIQSWWSKNTSGNEAHLGVVEIKFGSGAFINVKVDQINPNSYYRWVCVDAHPEWLNTIIEFKLSRANNKTKVEFYHSGWAEQSEFFANCNFSWARYFISLKNLLEKGQGEPYSD